MFSEFLKVNQHHTHYYQELCRYIEKNISGERPLIATHGLCTDGGTSGAIMHHRMPEAVIIPLDYAFLNHPDARDILADIDWYGIIDLSPFNNKAIDFWIDHHKSAMKKSINARRIHFDVDGDSGAYQLFKSGFFGPLPHHLVELAVMTRTTDTAGYIIEPPVTTYNKLSELIITETEGEEGRRQNEQRIWLLDDAWGSVTNLKEQLVMYQKLAKHGFMGIEHALPRINALREKRKVAYEQADGMELHDLVIYSFKADSLDNFTITRRLQARGVKVVISMSIEPQGVKLSFRRNRNLSDADIKKIQLNELAESMGGGGHAGASGAYVDNIEEALEKIKDWNQNIGLDLFYTEISRHQE